MPHYNGVGSVSAAFGGGGLPPNVYGDMSVLRRLNSKTLCQRHLFLGDSQYVGEFQNYLVPNASRLLFRGTELTFQSYYGTGSISGVTTTKQLGASGHLTMLANEGTTGLATLTQTSFAEQKATATTALGAGADRTSASTYATPAAALWARFQGQNVNANVLYRTFADGVTASNVAIQAYLGNATTSPNYVRSAGFSTKSGSPAWHLATATLGNTATWGSNGLAIETVFIAGQNPVVGETQEWDIAPWVELPGAAGIMGHDQAIAGQSIAGFLSPDTDSTWWSAGNFAAKAQAGETVTLWIGIGTNDTDTAENYAAKLATVIASFRGQFPGADVILRTAHAHSSDTVGVLPFYARAMIALAKANSSSGILCWDSYTDLGTYAALNALGYYVDGTHFNQTGRTYEATTLNSRLGLQ